jgi:CHAD domain-containing protein
MNAELIPSDASTQGVQRVLCSQIDEAVASLRSERLSDRQVHDARKSLKKARATLRLMRAALPEATYRRANAALRDAARPLSALRDARILIDTIHGLEKLYGPAAAQSAPAAFRNELTRQEAALRRSTVRKPVAVRKSLQTVRDRVGGWKVKDRGWRDIGAGVERVYRHGRRAMNQARVKPDAECLHEWRKQTKYLWHQLQTLEPLRPGRIGDLADQAHKLSDYLGDDHDLAVLRGKALKHRRAFDSNAGPAALLALIDRSQAQLRAKAFLAGGRIYADKPRAFAARLGKHWERWRAKSDRSISTRAARRHG